MLAAVALLSHAQLAGAHSGAFAASAGAWAAQASSVLPSSSARASAPPSFSVAHPSSAAEIVERMMHANRLRDARLRRYTSLRRYRVEYQGMAHMNAEMEAEVTYDAHAGKSYRILSQSGSRSLCDKVLRRALDSEREAAADQASTALSPANYSFRLLGSESVEGRPAYLLAVEPIGASHFLYRGRIWIDAADYALVRIDASPARNPSFWISKTLVQQSFARTGEFWLPARNRSETHVRVGGTAVFTIDYGAYRCESSAALASRANLR